MLALVLACSDDGAPADSNTLSDSNSSVEDGGTGTASESATASESLTASAGESASDGADEGPGSSGQGTGDDGTSAADTSDTGPSSGGSCRLDEDCVVVDDCCNCSVVPVGERPTCDIPECRQSTCSANGFTPMAHCEIGSCEPVPVPCDPALVACESLPPECAEGSFPGVDAETSCWTGECVPADACETVPSCADCPEDEVCVEYVTQIGPQYHCSPVPESCEGEPSCACMAEACESPWDLCNEVENGLSCGCPACG